MVALYPERSSHLERNRTLALAVIPDGTEKEHGIALGLAAAAAVIASRSADGADDKSVHRAGSASGDWIPTPPAGAAALEPGWGRVRPFTLTRGAQFRPAPPPALDSAVYAADLTEVAAIGSIGSTRRSPYQTETGRFWVTTAPQLWNQAAQQLIRSHSLDAAAAARAFLLLNIAGADALIGAWDAKYTYNQWRPVTAIRVGAASASEASASWEPLVPTPPFPDYPAGHTAYGGAAEVALTAVFGAQPGEFFLTSATAGDATRGYRNFGDVAAEVVEARILCGAHWRTSCTVGRRLGQDIGRYTLAQRPFNLSGSKHPDKSPSRIEQRP